MSKSIHRLNLGLGLSLFLIIALTTYVFFASASEVTSMTDTLSNQQISQVSSHKILFTLTSGNTFAAGESVVIDFHEDDGRFVINGASLATADVSVNDGTLRVIYSVTNGTADCSGSSGTNDIAVGVNDTTGVVTLTACPSFSASAAGATVTVLIGEDAGGTDRITNPGTAGGYVVDITDAVGDCTGFNDACHMSVPIIDSGGVSVTALVDPVCGNTLFEPGEQCDDGNTNPGDGCDEVCRLEAAPPPPDTTPPPISNVRATDITADSAIVRWDTGESSNSKVDYGLTSAYGSTVSDAAIVTIHAVTLSTLSENTTYHYRVCSTDGVGNQACSGDNTFVTLDETPPVISNVVILDITDSGATFTWDTDENSDSNVDYDTSAGPPYGNTSSDASMVTSHTIDLSGLSPSTTYHYRVRSVDGAANEGFTSDASFTTAAPPDTTQPVISNVQVTGITQTEATITWDTDENSDSNVDYDTSAGPPYGNTSSDASMVTSHTITLTGLITDTLYHFSVRSADASSNEASSTDATFNTLPPPDTTPPVISNVQVTGITPTEATITWTTDEQATQFVDYDTSAGPPYGNTAGSATPLQTGHLIVLSGLSSDTTYHFSVRSADDVGNEASSADATFTTSDTTPPVISNVQVTGITQTTVTITWTTDENSDSVVEYGTTVSYGSSTSDPANVKNHTITLTGLLPATQYHFRVKSTDPSANQSVSTDQTFTTAAPLPPVISNVQVTGITQTTVTITWTTDTLADSKVDFGLTESYGSTRADTTDVTFHSVLLDGLLKNTTYHFRVRSEDSSNQEVSTADDTFTTAADVTPPDNVAGFAATPGVNSVDLTWTNPIDPDFDGVWIVRKEGSQPTDKDDGTWVYIDIGTSYTDVGLENAKTYYYGAFAFDDVPNYSSGAFASATPEGPIDLMPPPNVDPFTASAGDQQIQLTWTNPTDPDFVGVRIMRKEVGFPIDKDDGTLVYDGNDGSKLDTGLTNGTAYYYGAFSYDGALNYSSGSYTSGTPVTPPDFSPPGPVTNFLADAGGAQIQLTWTNPTDVDFAGVRILRKTGSAPAFNTDGTIVYEGLLDNRLDTALTNGTTYYYAAFTFDSSGNWSGAVSTNATPNAGEVAAPPSCADTDGGKNYVLRGAVTEGESIYQDVCASSSNLIENYCSVGASRVEVYDCGEGFKCSAGRCVADISIADSEVCGNGICAVAENSLNCPIDCPVASTEDEVAVEEPTVGEDIKLGVDDIHFFSSGNRLRIRSVEGNRIITFPTMTITVYFPDESIHKPVRSAFVNFRGNAYAMRLSASLETDMLTPKDIGEYPIVVVVNYEDDTNDTIDFVLDVQAFGIVYEIVDGDRVPVKDARVTLLKDIGGGNFDVVDTAQYDQLNPQLSSGTGTYGYIVPPGIYKLTAEKAGYRTKQKIRFPLVGNLVKVDMQLIVIPPPPVEEIAGILETDASATEKAVEVTKVVAEQVAFRTKAVIEDITEVITNEIVEEATEDIAAPAVVVVAVANVASASAATATAVPYMMYLYSFLAHPTLLIARRRRKKWGIVFNAITKMPVDLAIVRLVDAETGRIIRSAVTDKGGRYFFIAPEGKYKLQVTKNGFLFPTEYMKDEKADPKYLDIYQGEIIEAKKGTVLTANIPVDPVEKTETPRSVVLAGIGRRFQKSVGLLSIAGMVVAVIISPSAIIIGMLAGNVLLYLIFRRLAIGRVPKNWGIVYDKSTGKPLRNAVARIFESKYNKLLETQVTDARGRYAFLVGNNVYYVTFEKPGYRKHETGQIDLIELKKEADQIVAKDVKLERAEKIKKAREEKEGKKPSLIMSAEEIKKAREEKKEETQDSQGEAAAVRPGEDVTGTEKLVETKVDEGGGKTSWELEVLKELEGGDDTGEATDKKDEKQGQPDQTRRDAAEATEGQPLAGSAVGTVEEKVEGQPKDKPFSDTPWELEMRKQIEGGEIGELSDEERADDSSSEGSAGEVSDDIKGTLEEGDALKYSPQEDMSDAKKPAPIAGPSEGQRLIQDVVSAHPETKLVEDADHAHPDEQRDVAESDAKDEESSDEEEKKENNE